MWIAKNSKTNETYGKKYNSIYDCQSYIDRELYILEYLYRRCEVITKSIKNQDDFKKYMNKKYPNGYSVIQQMCECLNFAMEPFQKQIKKILLGKEIKKIAEDEYRSNNIIRCYNLGQHRYADSFDF